MASVHSCALLAPAALPRSSPCTSSRSWDSWKCCRTSGASAYGRLRVLSRQRRFRSRQQCAAHSVSHHVPISFALALALCVSVSCYDDDCCDCDYDEPIHKRAQRRLRDTLADIRAFEPDVVLTIDSKGFTFRVLKALHADPATRDAITRMHYVAPSVWAYKHCRRQASDGDGSGELRQLLHRMFTILPFEDALFLRASDASDSSGTSVKSAAPWCCYVGHPAVEDFLEHHGQFDRPAATASTTHSATTTTTKSDASPVTAPLRLQTDADALLDVTKYDLQQLAARGALFESLMRRGRSSSLRESARAAFGIPTDALVICALVGRCDRLLWL